MISIQTKNTTASQIAEPVYGSGEQVERILVGAIEEHQTGPERYCRYLHIVTQAGELVLEVWAANEAALALKNVGEDAHYVLEDER